MNRYLIAAVAALGFIAAVVLYLDRRDAAVEERTSAIERAKIAAQSNQNIAERRKTDATFDKMDARAMCLDAGLEWLFEDGKSFCR